MWITQGDIILLSLRDFQDDKADVIHRYTPDEARSLKTYGELKSDFQINEGGEEGGFSDEEGGVEFEEAEIDDICGLPSPLLCRLANPFTESSASTTPLWPSRLHPPVWQYVSYPMLHNKKNLALACSFDLKWLRAPLIHALWLRLSNTWLSLFLLALLHSGNIYLQSIPSLYSTLPFLTASGRRLITRAGLPTTTQRGSTSLVTTEPAPTVQPSPMVTPARIMAPAQVSLCDSELG